MYMYRRIYFEEVTEHYTCKNAQHGYGLLTGLNNIELDSGHDNNVVTIFTVIITVITC